MKKLSLVCLVLLLSACGGGSKSYDIPPPAGGGVVTPSPTMADKFFTLVSQFLIPTNDDTDATPVETVEATQPEDTEPEPLS